MNNLCDEILYLIELGTEGDYWDFKKEWHTKKADLLHDIICMANNLANRDAYIVIGVSDSKSADGVKVFDVSADANRKNQQQLITFLRDKKFAGGIRPTVYLETLSIGSNQIDVILVKSTYNTPYYLAEDFKDDGYLRALHIYTRIGDTNTPKDKTADLDKVEHLWRKRFGIDMTVNEQLLKLLDAPDDWLGNLDAENRKYHSVYPEFQVMISEKEAEDTNFADDNSIVENLVAHNPNSHHSVSKIEITYHSTVLFSEYIIYLDGGRYVIPIPATDSVYLDRGHRLERSLTYLYFDLSTIQGKIYNCLLNHWYIKGNFEYSNGAHVLFNDKIEHEGFNRFVDQKLPELLEEYPKLLKSKGYREESQEDYGYFQFGWSKGNEIKARYLADKFAGKSPCLTKYIHAKREGV